MTKKMIKEHILNDNLQSHPLSDTINDEAISSYIKQDFNLDGNPEDHRIVVAMSGGVDSSVTAAMIKHAGFRTIGVTMQLYTQSKAIASSKTCCAGKDIADVKKVARHLDIEHYVVDYRKQFEEDVIKPFAHHYMQGRTPIPCIECNRTVKFRDMLQLAKTLKASALVTGHYAITKFEDTNRIMVCPADTKKDQTYFLFATTQDQLNFVRFPLGKLTKPQVRRIAEYYNLPVAEKPDSQDICFVNNGKKYSAIVNKVSTTPSKAGDIKHIDGRVIGRHNGIQNFTIGQRKGLGLDLNQKHYVVHINATNNTIWIGGQENLQIESLLIHDINWLGKEDYINKNQNIFVKLKSGESPKAARISFDGENSLIYLDLPQRSSAPGQACVFYSSNKPFAQMLGGGIIKKVNYVNNLELLEYGKTK